MMLQAYYYDLWDIIRMLTTDHSLGVCNQNKHTYLVLDSHLATTTKPILT